MAFPGISVLMAADLLWFVSWFVKHWKRFPSHPPAKFINMQLNHKIIFLAELSMYYSAF